jgi:V/A-type H+/Na+-transporting ATPase subunit D
MGVTGESGTPPTRAELLSLRRKIRLAEEGHHFLKLKVDVQILELRKMTHRYAEISRKCATVYRRAEGSMTIAQMMEGSLGIEVVAVAVEDNPEFSVTRRNVMGASLPVYSAIHVRKELANRGYGIFGTSSVIDETAESYEELVELIIQAAEVRSGLLQLVTEIEKTKRRVNALEVMIIPRLTARRDMIISLHNELEREELSRIFWIKKKTSRYRPV